MEIPGKSMNRNLMQPNPILDIYPQNTNTYIQKDVCTCMFTKVLNIKAIYGSNPNVNDR